MDFIPCLTSVCLALGGVITGERITPLKANMKEVLAGNWKVSGNQHLYPEQSILQMNLSLYQLFFVNGSIVEIPKPGYGYWLVDGFG